MLKENKKFFTAFMAILMISLVFSTGCASDDSITNSLSPKESEVVGTWVLTKIIVTGLGLDQILTPEQMDLSMSITANSDKTFTSTSRINGQNETNEGSWSINGDFLTLTSGSDTQILSYTIVGSTFTIKQTMLNGDVEYNQYLEFTKQ